MWKGLSYAMQGQACSIMAAKGITDQTYLIMRESECEMWIKTLGEMHQKYDALASTKSWDHGPYINKLFGGFHPNPIPSLQIEWACKPKCENEHDHNHNNIKNILIIDS